MLLSVVVVNWNSRDDLLSCLASLEAQTHQELQVIVVDNGSVDGSLEMVRTRFPQFTLLPQGENLGFAEGCNRGIEAASGTWVALLNNDAVADAHWAAKMIEAARAADARCGMLQSEMYFLHQPNTINSLGLYLTRSGGAIDREEGSPRRATAADEIFCPTGGACAYRKEMLERIKLPVGYFDRDYFMYSEDFDLGWRAQLCGWSARLVPGAFVLHRFHGSTVRRGRAFFVVHTRVNRLRTLIKNASWAFFLRTAPYSLYEIGELLWFGRWGGAKALRRGVVESMRLRRRVKSLAFHQRKTTEARWVGTTHRMSGA